MVSNRRAMAWTLALTLLPVFAAGQELSNNAFRIQYGAGGITSLRRTNDTHDTEYIARGGALGNVLIQYRTGGQSGWTMAREIMAGPAAPGSSTVTYMIGMLAPTLPQLSAASASVDGTSLGALSDGQIPFAPPNAPRGASTGRASAGPPPPPAFTWRDQRGSTQWVQYTFPSPQEISTAQVYWALEDPPGAAVREPASWRLLYQDGSRWNEVKASTPYGVEQGQFNRVDFAPLKTTALRMEVKMAEGASAAIYEWRVGPDRVVIAPNEIRAQESFKLDGEYLDWTLTIANQTAQTVEIGDLGLPLSMAEGTPAGRGQIYTQKLIRHSFVAGHGSWVYWQRANAEGPFLVMLPQRHTKLEYSGIVATGESVEGARSPFGGRGSFTAFIHGAVSSAGPIAQGKKAGREQPWRLPITSLSLTPKGAKGDFVTYSFRFTWAKDFDDVRRVLVNGESLDVKIVPGMVLPSDLPAQISLRTNQKINSVVAEFAGKTKLEFAGERDGGHKIYKVRFSKLGENMLTVKYGSGKWSTLQFFITEPLETVIKKRANFLVSRMQHKDPSQWWYGVYSDWDQTNKVLRSPNDRDGLSAWLTDASDDAGNARPAFVASKNVFFPDQAEIASVELYIKQYLFNGNRWDRGIGGMQMTDQEPYPYGIYGTFDNWYQHRTIDPNPPANFRPQNASLPLEVGWTRLHREHLWRIYDYPHIMLLYFRMYQVAKMYPAMVRYANADEYLMLAYNTSVAYWTVPMQTDKPRGWSANSVPTMNEAFLPELISALEREGKKKEAARLHELWNGKVERFVNPRTRPNLFGSEFAFDSTGFEATAAMAHYAMDQIPKGQGPYTEEQAREFLHFQLRLNMGDRGWLENTYYQLGSDYRGGLTYLLSYMSQMGGWGVLDYAIHFAQEPAEYLRLGYASSLSSWALVNSGTPESNYGFWWPGKENDGAVGGGFMPEPIGGSWIRKTVPRGAWYYSAEQDVGYCGALRTHATIVTRDPLFGEIAYGGLLTRKSGAISVVPRDGLRARFLVVRDDQRLHLELLGAGFAAEHPVMVDDQLTRIHFMIEKRVKEAPNAEAPNAQLRVRGLPAGDYRLSVDGQTRAIKMPRDAGDQLLQLPAAGTTAKIMIERIG